MTYRIASDIELPEFTGKSWNTVYPWAQMHEGDSILVERSKVESARRSASGFSVRHPGWKFTARSEGDGLRIWCLRRPKQRQQTNKTKKIIKLDQRPVASFVQLAPSPAVLISQLPVRLVKRMA